MNLANRIKAQPRLGLIILAYIAFISLGMPDGLFGVALPSIRASFSVPLDAVGAIFIVSTAGYMLSSFYSGFLISRLGVGRVLAISCALTGSVLIGDTLVPNWASMVALGLGAGLGAGAIDAGLNTYVAAHFGEGLMQWLHASYGIGVTLGPIIMTFALTSLNSWRAGYRIVGIFQLLLATGFALTLSMWNQEETSPTVEQPQQRLTDYKTPMSETLRQPRVWLSVLLFLFYTGAEVTLGTWVYTLLTESRGVDPTAAGFWTGSYWAMFTVGRVLAGLYTRHVRANTLVRGSLSAALGGTLLLLWNPAPVANLIAVAVCGFAIAPIFPALVSGTSQRVGERFAANTIGMQIAGGGLGSAIVPAIAGVLARQFSLEVIPLWLVGLFVALLTVFQVLSRQTGKSARSNA